MNFIGSKYQGLKTTDLKRFHGLGQYTFPNGDRYVGGFYDGCFHGYGVIFYRMRENQDALAKRKTSKGVRDNRGRKMDVVEQEREDLYAFLDGRGATTPSRALDSRGSTTPLRLREGRGATTPSKGFDNEYGAPSGPLKELTPEEEAEAEQRIVWHGQYRGLWEHGKNVSGCYVFSDGLVYGGQAMKNDSLEEKQAAEEACSAWPYCQCSDHRLWAEHLRNITPVLPYEAAFGGVHLQQEFRETLDQLQPNHSQRFWSEMPILVPSSCEQEMIPSSFAGGQPRGGRDVAAKWWTKPSQREEVVATLALPTDPLVAEEDPDHYDVVGRAKEDSSGDEKEDAEAAANVPEEGAHKHGRIVENPNLQIRYPINITDGSRTLTPCEPRYGAPMVYCTGINRRDEEKATVKPKEEIPAEIMPDAVVDMDEDGE